MMAAEKRRNGRYVQANNTCMLRGLLVLLSWNTFDVAKQKNDETVCLVVMMYFVSQAHLGTHTAFPITCVSLPERTGGSERGTSLLDTPPTYSVTCCSSRGLYFSVVRICVVLVRFLRQ